MLYRYLHPTRSEDGYSLIEMLVVVVMIGILALIAAPSWLSLMNVRRASAVRADIVQGLRDAQNQAQQQRSNQTVTVRYAPGVLPTVESAGSAARVVGGGEVPANQVTVTVTPNPPTPNELTLTYNELGALDDATPIPTQITVEVGTVRRCVLVDNLLGTLRQRDGGDCP